MDTAIILFFTFAAFVTVLSLASRRYVTTITTSLFAGLMWMVLAANFYSSSVTFAIMFGIFGIIIMMLGALNLWRVVR